jgi:CRISPR-associated protein (TIGR02584 family)
MVVEQPEDYPRRILLCVPGFNPQVVTHALYALAVANDPAFIPTEIRAITTTEGATRIKLALLDESSGHFYRFCSDFSIPLNSIRFDVTTIHLITDRKGMPLTDIRSSDDNSAAADSITEIVRELSNDPDCAIHASIAGSRKTVGFYVGYALSLFGRAQDRMSHVLISEPFEENWLFWYPPPVEQIITSPDHRLFSTKEAKISLALMPFVRLRDSLSSFNPKPKIFISYSRRDEDQAKRLFDDLSRKGCSPWFDKETLLPGQNWREEIQRTIRSCDFVILLLSKNSIDRRGFFQTELRLAMDTLETIPEGDIFAIPLKLDDCRIPDCLASLHCVDLFVDYDRGVRQLLRAINARNKQTEFLV